MPQKPKCPACGITLFILPATTYPLPKSLVEKWAGPSSDAETPSVSVKESRSDKKGGKKSARPSSENKTAKSHAAAERSPGFPTVPVKRRPWITPLRMIVLTVLGGLFLSGYLLVRKGSRDHAQSILQGAIDRGTEALEAQNYNDAVRELETARQALDILKRSDPDAQKIRRTLREAEVASQLLDSDFPQILEQWISGKPIQSSLENLTRTGWILFDAAIQKVPHPDGHEVPVLEIDFPLLINDVPVQILMENRQWESLKGGTAPERPQRILFAAQIQRGQLPARKEDPAVVWLEGSTAVLWSDELILKQQKFLPQAPEEQSDFNTLLNQQREFLESQE